MSSAQPRRLFKSRTNRMIDGVCGGLATYLGLDPTLVRVLVVLFAIMGGAGIVFYIAGMILIPPEIPGESSAPGGVEQRPPATAMLTLLAGALLIAVGVLFLLENLDVLHWRHAWRVMRDILVPMLVIAIGVALLLRSRKDRKPAEPGVPLEQSPLPTGQWYRARDGRRILGICSGIAKAMNVDVTLVRFAWVIFTLFSGGVGVIGYILLAIVLPEEPITNGNA